MINTIFTALHAHGVEEHVDKAIEQTESLGSILITLHPKFVHFPIAIIILVLLFEMLFVVKKVHFFKQAVHWLFSLGLLASSTAIATGLLSADSIGHNTPAHDMVHDHRNIMIAASILWLVTGIAYKFWPAFKSNFRNLFRFVIVFIVALFVWGSHEGGELVYEKGVGVEPVMKSWQTKKPSSLNILNKKTKVPNDHEGSHNH